MTRRARVAGGVSGIGAKVKRPRRDWALVNAKVEAEDFRCRGCGKWPGEYQRLERAHVIGRAMDYTPPVNWPSDAKWITRSSVYVVPARIVPLCGPVGDETTCHGKDHAGIFEWLPILTVAEQIQAVADAGGINPALHRLIAARPAIVAVEGDRYDPGDEIERADELDIPF